MSTTIKSLGTVEFSGKVVVSDPSYSRGTWCMKTDLPVKPGTYHVYAAYSNEGEWGLRVAALAFYHEEHMPLTPVSEWHEIAANIGVDSGQCGIFDDTIYPQTIDHPDHPFYMECCNITLANGCAGILRSGKGAVSSSGFGDGVYTISVVERDGENVALLLDYDLVKMRPLIMALLNQSDSEDDDDQEPAIYQIMKDVAVEINAYREATQKLSGKEVYEKAFEIHLWEQMSFLIRECPEDYEEDEDILSVLDQLSAGGSFLAAFVEWAMSQDSVDVTNTETTLDALERFCKDWLSDGQ